MGDKLTPKQEEFARVYVETSNASEAYRQAYDVGEKTKPNVIWVKASETLANGKVSVRVAELLMLAQERLCDSRALSAGLWWLAVGQNVFHLLRNRYARSKGTRVSARCISPRRCRCQAIDRE